MMWILRGSGWIGMGMIIGPESPEPENEGEVDRTGL